MGFIVSKKPMLGGNSGLAVPDYRVRNVSGYPVMLKKPLEIREIIIRGNHNGTGDKTINNYSRYFYICQQLL